MTCFIEICACCETDLKNTDFRNYVYRSDSAVIYGTISDFLFAGLTTTAWQARSTDTYSFLKNSTYDRT